MVTYACQIKIRQTRMKNIILISAACLLALLSTIGASLPYPILPPLFAAEAPNAFNNFLGLPSKLLFGLALTINPLGLLIGSALLGPLSDRYGRRPLLMRTAVGAAIGHALEALERDPDDKVANSIVAVSGLRLSGKALADLSRQNNLNGSLRSEAQELAKLLRASIGEDVLVPPARRPPAAGKRAAGSGTSAAKGAAAPGIAADPFSGLK